MDRNELDIKLLRENPDQLLIRFQPVIRIIVRKLCYQGFLPRSETADLVQEINRKLIERLPRIRDQYNGKCQLRTYLSVVIRNICLEEFRKPRLVAEPRAELYEQASEDLSWNQIIIAQEYQRLKRAVSLFGRERSALWTTLRCYADLPVTAGDLTGFDLDPGEEAREQLALMLNDTLNKQKREKLDALGQVFSALGKKPQNPEALRKWSASRIGELISLMNSKAHGSSYSPETLNLLMEKSEIAENSE
ncbi:MAG: sigma-70 family RNA polymerase sigma factor [Bacteroidales bacterium]